MTFLLIFLSMFLPSLLASNDPAHDIKILKLQMKVLVKLQAETNQKLVLTNQRLTKLKQETNQNLTDGNKLLNQMAIQTDLKLTKLEKGVNQNLTRGNNELSSKLIQSSQVLEQKLTQHFARTNQAMNQKLTKTSQEVLKLKTKEQTLNRFCNSKPNACGSCYCIEDFNIADKYFCDCRSKPVKRDCKEHHVQGGWTLFQRRVDGTTNFYRNWKPYKEGFGQLQHEHWLGNDYLHLLTTQAVLTGSEMRFELGIKDRSYKNYAKYSSFHVDSESNAYQLHIKGYSGNIGGTEPSLAHHNKRKFTTPDFDNDDWSGGNCARDRRGAFWFGGCAWINPNGAYDDYKQASDVLYSFSWHPFWLQSSEMKVRRK
uniref:Fibrinogen C-terminal domain-containing protein n=1 Tax=Clytia hemisphaerica TaxID=252671 RepID=A0A7M5TQT8_9CNID